MPFIALGLIVAVQEPLCPGGRFPLPTPYVPHSPYPPGSPFQFLSIRPPPLIFIFSLFSQPSYHHSHCAPLSLLEPLPHSLPHFRPSCGPIICFRNEPAAHSICSFYISPLGRNDWGLNCAGHRGRHNLGNLETSFPPTIRATGAKRSNGVDSNHPDCRCRP